MAKKIKKPSKSRARTARPARQNWCQMVIRVKVPLKQAKHMKAHMVHGLRDDHGPIHLLEILNAYYDLPGHPNARS